MTEEIFGPLYPCFTYKKIDEAIDYINDAQEKPLVVYNSYNYSHLIIEWTKFQMPSFKRKPIYF